MSALQAPRGVGALVVLGLAVLASAVVAFGLTGRSEPEEQWLPQVPLPELVQAIRAGEEVVFVDVREPAEFAEFRVPGALNVPARAMGDPLRERLARARYVVPYCLKDFRGFEGGKRLRRLGVDNVVLMEGYGIGAWKAAGLPLAGAQPGRSDDEARQDLLAAPGAEAR